MKDFLQLCKDRGYLHQCTDEEGLSKLFTSECVPAYIGFDCTAPSLHVGSLVQIMMLRHLQKCGHKPIVLMGGGTTKIGDPSGKDEARKMLTDEKIQENMDGIKAVFAKFLTFGDGATDAIMVNNDEWLKDINYISFLRDYGRHFSVNRMMTMESVKQRLDRESHLSFLEFNYMILQAYDFVKLNQRHACRLQIGGSDQWGNIVMGSELYNSIVTERFDNRHSEEAEYSYEDNMIKIKAYSFEDVSKKESKDKIKFVSEKLPEENRDWEISRVISHYREHNQILELTVFWKKRLFGLTSPLITTASGAKMGKTASGAVWLNHDPANPDYSRSPYEYWQFWRNVDDGDVKYHNEKEFGRFLKLFTDLPIDEIEKISRGDVNEAKKILATEATTLLHGEAAAKEAAETARKVFEQGGTGDALPEIKIGRTDLEEGWPVYKAIYEAGLSKSLKMARKDIEGGGVRVNGNKIDDSFYLLTLDHLNAEGHIKLSVGKKRHALVKAA